MHEIDKINQNGDTREKILASATKLFEEKGYHSTSIKEICEKANISRGGLFYHFNSKEDILVLIHDKFISYELKQAREVLQNKNNPLLTLKELLTCLVESIGKFKPYVVVFFQERKFLSRDNFKEIREKRDEYEGIFCQTIKRGIKEGYFRKDIDPIIIVKGIFGMCNWTYQWLDPEGNIPPREIGEIFYNMIIEGLKKETAN